MREVGERCGAVAFRFPLFYKIKRLLQTRLAGKM
jgi:hypothetical protein